MEITPEVQALLEAQKTELTSTFEADTKGLKLKMDELLGEKKAEQAKAEEARIAQEAASLAKAETDKDVDGIKNSYQKKVDDLTSELDGMRLSNKQSAIASLASDFVSANVVDDPFSRKAMSDEYASRIDIRDGRPVVLDANGGATINSIEDLQSEFRGAGIYASHIKGTDGSGGGAITPKLSGGAAKKSSLSGVVEGFDALPIR
jgi:hypothetical protein